MKSVNRIFGAILILIFCLLMITTGAASQPAIQPVVDIQGHRGCRGLLPENTIPAFLKAVELGVSTLEMDVVISKDDMVVVSHEPWFNPDICLDPEGNHIRNGKRVSFLQLDYSEIKKYDCGSLRHPRFRLQQPVAAYKPRLDEVIDSVENYILKKNLPPVRYNIELKCKPSWDNIYTPPPDKFIRLVYDVIKQKGIAHRTIIQSFDERPLQILRHSIDAEIQIALLIDNLHSIGQNLQTLGFTPEVYSPYYKLLTKKKIRQIHQLGMKVIPWTVNRRRDIDKLLRNGVDGIITDYPDRAILAAESSGLKILH